MKNLICFFLAMALFAAPALLQAQPPKPKDFGIKSQKALDRYLEGRQQSQWRDWYKAISAFEQAVVLEPAFAEAYFQLGVACVVVQEYEKAVKALGQAEALKPGGFGGMGYQMGQAYFYTGQYAKAIPQYQAYLDEGRGGPTFIKTAELNLGHAIFAAEAIQQPVPFDPLNLGPEINTADDEVTPVLSADGQFLLFLRSKADTSKSNQLRPVYNREDFYYSNLQEGKWLKAKNLGPPINTDLNEGTPSLSQDGRTIYFTACNREGSLGGCDLYISNWSGNAWSEPVNLGEGINSDAWESHPCLSHDGQRLYFASNRPGGRGGRDIWYATLQNGVWSNARNLGEVINTPGNDDLPFIHADGRSLYFASDFHPGFGKRDIFVSHKDIQNRWSTPQNLGYPINGPGDDGYIFIDTKGSRAYINSEKKDGYGGNDIYTFELPPAVRPQVATYVRGICRDSLSGAPVQARLRVLDIETGDTLRTLFSGKTDGRFLMSLPLERAYAVHVEAPRYLFVSKSFFLKNLPDSVYFDLIINLLPMRSGAEVRLDNVFFDFGKYDLKPESEPELRFLLNYLQQNPRLQVEIQGHTDDVGRDADNLRLSQQRADAVRNWLIDRGTAPERLQAKGYGESQPLAPNDSEAGRALNRRTAFKVLAL